MCYQVQTSIINHLKMVLHSLLMKLMILEVLVFFQPLLAFAESFSLTLLLVIFLITKDQKKF